jgi:hypothetical protein
LKITGCPAETYGLVSGEWKEIPPDAKKMNFSMVGAEEANGVTTDSYKSKGTNAADPLNSVYEYFLR